MRIILIISALFIGFFSNGQTIERINKSFSDTLFEPGDRILAPEIHHSLSAGIEFHDSIQVIADFLQKHPNLKIEIGVHTDSRGSYDSNQLLSERRANAIRHELVYNFKINPNRISIKGYGKSAPVVEEKFITQASTKHEREVFHQQNRRVELTIFE